MGRRGTRKEAERVAALAAEQLLRIGTSLRRTPTTPDLRAVYRTDQSVNDAPYRERWAHDRVVRSTHGVNCTGSCSWKVYVKDGVITWETQETDYPSVGPDRPEYEPRGCPRGASFSWYTYSPTRVRYPHVRGVLLELYREARERLGRLAATASSVANPYDYRLGVSVWFRSLFTLDPDVAAMAHAPLVYQVHAALAMVLFALWPFSRLIHAFTAPVGYLVRPYVVYRSRARAASTPHRTASRPDAQRRRAGTPR
ncbi:respiratory nitrate reductase subunit gamma [Streptomyces sp. NPDC057555]|uniref:respiratory nitrate reductase subunit gamma n=1 Tax=Streptomyces sp. NPDC057555 TaxID=3346166 RepID=UPI0036C880B3